MLVSHKKASPDVIDLDLSLLERRVDSLFALWAGKQGPGATIGIVLEGKLAVHRHADLASIEHERADRTRDTIPDSPLSPSSSPEPPR